MTDEHPQHHATNRPTQAAQTAQATQWEYCLVSTPPPGPVQVYITYHTTGGMKREIHHARDYEDGTNRLFPQIIAQMGLDGWELVSVDMAGTYYFKRPLAHPPARPAQQQQAQ